VEFRNRLLWVHTESLQVWLALLVEAAEELEATDEPWFATLIKSWRVQATVADLGCALEDGWSNEELGVVVQLAKATRERLAEPETVAHVLTPGWSVLDGEPVAAGVGSLRLVERITQVADAFVLLLQGALPPDPPGAWWFVGGRAETWDTIRERATE
jgi:hypothetical protein